MEVTGAGGLSMKEDDQAESCRSPSNRPSLAEPQHYEECDRNNKPVAFIHPADLRIAQLHRLKMADCPPLDPFDIAVIEGHRADGNIRLAFQLPQSFQIELAEHPASVLGEKFAGGSAQRAALLRAHAQNENLITGIAAGILNKFRKRFRLDSTGDEEYRPRNGFSFQK